MTANPVDGKVLEAGGARGERPEAVDKVVHAGSLASVQRRRARRRGKEGGGGARRRRRCKSCCGRVRRRTPSSISRRRARPRSGGGTGDKDEPCGRGARRPRRVARRSPRRSLLLVPPHPQCDSLAQQHQHHQSTRALPTHPHPPRSSHLDPHPPRPASTRRSRARLASSTRPDQGASSPRLGGATSSPLTLATPATARSPPPSSTSATADSSAVRPSPLRAPSTKERDDGWKLTLHTLAPAAR